MSWVCERKHYLGLLGVLLSFALLLSACSGDDPGDGAEGATTTTASDASSLEETANTNMGKGVLGGKSKEEYEESIGSLEGQLADSPEDLGLLAEFAVAQYQTGRYEEAVDTYEKMLALDDQPLVRNNYANVLRDAGRKEDAKKEYEKALAEDPQLVVAYINLASVLFYEDNKQDALAVLDRGIANTSGEDQERLEKIKEGFSG
jgi:predicted Zn-dependent protease